MLQRVLRLVILLSVLQMISGVTVANNLASTALVFTKNMGQWPEQVLFRTDAGGATVWITTTGVTYQFTRRVERTDASLSASSADASGRQTSSSAPDEAWAERIPRGFDTGSDSVETMIIKAEFVSSNPNPEVVADGLMEYKCNYFLGNEPDKWRTDVPNFAAVTLRNVYDGVDLSFSAGAEGKLTYEYSVVSGTDVSQIEVAYNGGAEVMEDAEGQMSAQTEWGEIRGLLASPVSERDLMTLELAYVSDQAVAGERSWQESEQISSLEVDLNFCTYLGGTDTDHAEGIAVDDNGNTYVTGETGSVDYPVESPFLPTYQGNGDIFLSKLSADGTSLIYSTYFGGSDGDDCKGIAVDGNGNAFVTGSTYSSNFPVLNAYQGQKNGYGPDAFVSKFSASGNTLIYSTYLGGGGEDRGSDIACSKAGSEACVTGFTGSSDFPTLNPFQGDQGDIDIFVTKLSADGNSLMYSTYLGGASADYGYDVEVDDHGNAYVTGSTASYDFPFKDPYIRYTGNVDAFVTKLSAAGSSLIYSTCLGGSGGDVGNGIAVDLAGNAYLTGYTASADFPIQNPFQTDQPNVDAFVAELSPAGNNLLYSTFIGGYSEDWGSGIAVDAGGANVLVTGFTYSSDFPTENAFQADQPGLDAFLFRLSTAGYTLPYCTYFGGSGYDRGVALAMDGSGHAYVMGHTSSSDFPVHNPIHPFRGDMDIFAAKFNFLIGCCTGYVGDANGAGGDEPTIGDVSRIIDAKFISGACYGLLNCLSESDINQSGGVNPGCDDITIGDISILVDYLFITGQSLGLPDCQ